MDELKKFLNPVFFIIVLVCFFLPFYNITCQQQKIASINGFELITGTTMTTNGLNKALSEIPNSQTEIDKVKTDTVSPEPLALVAFMIAIIGLIISFFNKVADIGSAIAGFLGVLVLIYLSSVINDNVLGKIQFQPLTVEYGLGYYIAIISFSLLLIYNIYIYIQRITCKPSNLGSLESRMRFCPRCNAMNDMVSIYCNRCGNIMEENSI